MSPGRIHFAWLCSLAINQKRGGDHGQAQEPTAAPSAEGSQCLIGWNRRRYSVCTSEGGRVLTSLIGSRDLGLAR